MVREKGPTPLQTIAELGPVLLRIVTGEKAVSLNRAAAGDVHETGTLGGLIADGGKATIMPLVAEVLEAAMSNGFAKAGRSSRSRRYLHRPADQRPPNPTGDRRAWPVVRPGHQQPRQPGSPADGASVCGFLRRRCLPKSVRPRQRLSEALCCCNRSSKRR